MWDTETVSPTPERAQALHSAKGGAVETGCSALHYTMYCYIVQDNPHPLHPPPTSPPFADYPGQGARAVRQELRRRPLGGRRVRGRLPGVEIFRAKIRVVLVKVAS